MAWNVSRAHSFLSATHAKRERGNYQHVSRNIGTFPTSIDVHSYPSNIPNIPYTNIYYGPLSLGTPSQQFQHGNPLHPLGTLECPYIEQPQTIHPFPATNIPLHGWQQSTSLLQNSLGPPQSHERIEPGHLGLSLCASTSSGPPPAAVTTNLRREPVDRSATNSPPR